MADVSDPIVPDLPDYRQFVVDVLDMPGNRRVQKIVFAHTVSIIAGGQFPAAVFSHVVTFTEGGMAITQTSRAIANVLDMQDLGPVDNSGIQQ